MPRSTETECGPCTTAEREAALGEDMIAAAPPRPETHAVVIGHRTLPLVLTLMHRGCAAVAGLQLGTRAPDSEPADLAWIADPRTDAELHAAMEAACHRIGPQGRVVLDVTSLAQAGGLAAVQRLITAFGLSVASIGDSSLHLILVATRAPTMARAA
ncbi:hypothetical protein FHP25_02635 [Vineibacter terrae]|uniref:Uncharacterized protein n=1 Tax=Vineibacter terrae TaxID=2586908 RepID=A0A5C8PVH7_9HYPH|nr:hypothetical protein [Vineibacter terrae]TXL81983.1 hypothetical protein FHP25_02635 [Vineibacter terrae]